MLNLNAQTNQQSAVQATYVQYSRAAQNYILATSSTVLITTGFSWLLDAAGAETAGAPEEYGLNTEIEKNLIIREKTALQSQLSYLTQHRSLQQTPPQSDTIIEGSIIGQLSLNTEITDYTVRDNYAYVTAGESGLHIIDVTDASNPITVGQYNTTGFAHQLQLVGNYTYIAYDLTGLRIVDVSDVSNPFLAGVYMMGDNPAKEAVNQVTVVGDVAILGKPDSTELRGVDVSEPSQVFRVYHDTPGNAESIAIEKNIACVADGDAGLQIFDISNPTNLQLVGSYNTSGYAYGVTIAGNIVYVADGASGLQVIDISTSSNPQLVSSYDTPDSAHDVAVIGNLAYVADYGSGLQIIDVSVLTNLQLLRRYNTRGRALAITVAGNLAYVADEWEGLLIIDISNPSTPNSVGSYEPSGRAYGLTVVDSVIYVVTPFGLEIIDASNPANPQLVSSYDTARTVYIPCGVAVIDKLAYLSDEREGLHVIDVSDPANPQLVSRYDTPGDAKGVAVVGDLAYVVDNFSGLQVINTNCEEQARTFVFSVGQERTQLFSHKNYLFYPLQGVAFVAISDNDLIYKGYDTPDVALGVKIIGNLAYVADGLSGLQIINISNPVHPQLVGTYDPLGETEDMKVMGNLACLVNGGAGIEIIDISNPINPQLVDGYNGGSRSSYAQDVAVVGNLIYLAEGALKIIDIGTPDNLQLISSYDTGVPRGVIVTNNLAYVADSSSGLQVVDVSNPVTPQLVGSYDTPGVAVGIAVVSHLAYVAEGDSGVQIIDISDPINLLLIGGYNTTGFTEDVTVDGNLVYVADGAPGLQVIDAANPTRLELIRTFNTPAYAYDVDIANNTAYVADGDAGLEIIDLSFQDLTFSTEGMASSMTAFGDIAYLTDTRKNLYILDITDPSNMIEISCYQLAYHALDIEFFDNYLYVAQGVDGIEIIDVRNPNAPIQVSHNITGIKDVKNLEIDNNRLYVENMAGEVQIIELALHILGTPVMLNNQLFVNEGELITFSSNDLSATNTEIPDTAIEFIIEDVINGQFEHQSERDTIINRFTQQQLMDGAIRFASLSFKGITNSTVFYRVAATNGVQSTFLDAAVDFNARPRWIKNYLKIKRGEIITFSSKELSATDFDDHDADLRFGILNLQHGQFIWKDGSPTQQFWQGNITDGLIQFRHDNSKHAPSYQVRVYDKRMVVGNDTVRVVFDKASFTEADNTPVITGGIIAGAVGLGLIGFGLFAVGRHISNIRSHKKYPFADYLAQALKLPGVENFNSPQGKIYLAAIGLLSAALSEQGYEMAHMDEGAQKEWATDIAAAAKNMITAKTTCCGESKITAASLHAQLQSEPGDFVQRILEYRFQSPGSLMEFTA